MVNHRAEREEDDLDRLFSALSDRSRRHIVARLALEGPLTAGELGAPLSIAKSTVSRLQPRGLMVAQRWLGRTAANGMRRRRGAS